jgi:hypothetical protein
VPEGKFVGNGEQQLGNVYGKGEGRENGFDSFYGGKDNPFASPRNEWMNGGTFSFQKATLGPFFLSLPFSNDRMEAGSNDYGEPFVV